MVAVSITREEHDAADLRREASRSRDADAARRMLALALVLEGASRTDAARTCGMDRQTLRDWVHRYNAEGLAGLSDRRGQVGPKPRLLPEQEAVVAELVRQGPDLAEHGVVLWRRADLAAVIATRFEVRLAGRMVGPLPPPPWLPRVSVRPEAPADRGAAPGAEKKTSPPSLRQ